MDLVVWEVTCNLLLKIKGQNILEIKSILKLTQTSALLFIISETKEMLTGRPKLTEMVICRSHT